MFQAGIWHSGTPEEFLNHVKQAVHGCERKELFSDYATALKAHLKLMKEYKKAVKTLKAAQDNNGNEVLIKSLEEDRDAQLEAVAEHEGERQGAAEGFFSLYANLLSVKACVAWDKILSRQIKVTPGRT